jgi:hypothetical protein
MRGRGVTGKEELHRLVDRLPDSEARAAVRYLEYLCDLGADPVLQALREAPVDEEPISAEEGAESEAAWEDYVQGRDPGEPLEELRRQSA